MSTFSQAWRLIVKDPVNLFLALIPTGIALSLYLFVIAWAFRRSDYFGLLLRDYLPSPETAGIAGKFLTGLLVLFLFLVMSWTFVILVGLIAAPFNSMLSSRIETILAGKPVTEDKSKTLKEVARGMGKTFATELKKLAVIALMGAFAFVLNLFPPLYPLGLFLVAILFAVQFVDYSWSRHDWGAGNCIGDMMKNIIPYSASGLVFLFLVTIPILNALVPALATSYFTVLWLKRQKRIPA